MRELVVAVLAGVAAFFWVVGAGSESDSAGTRAVVDVFAAFGATGGAAGFAAGA
jgi:hypothetical protein